MIYGNSKPNINLFRGTEIEIQNLRKNNKIINYCFYFAWDSGNFYLGTNTNTLQKYGSGKANLNLTEIKQLASEMITNELKFFTDLVKNIELKVDTGSIVNKEAVLKILDEELEKRITSAVITDIVKDSMIRHSSEYIKVLTGDDLLKSLNVDISGYYYVTENSTDINNTFIQGNTYYINGLNIKNITYNSYLANNYVTPKINIINHNLPTNIMIGQSIDMVASIKISIDNIFYINDNPVILINGNMIQSSYKDNVITFHLILDTSKPADQKCTVQFYDIRGNIINHDIEISVIAPTYYGSDDSKIVESNIQNEFNKLQQLLTTNLNGTYDISVKLGEYCWFLVPKNIKFKINKIFSSGFLVPFVYITTVMHVINNVHIEYDCYRTTYALSNGTYTLDIKE